MAIGCQLRHLFVTILRDCVPANPRALWDKFWPHICDDLKYQLMHREILADPSDAQVQDYGLYLIDKLLSHSGKRLDNWKDSMPQIVENWGVIFENHLIMEQRGYNSEEQARLAERCIASLNDDQRAAFDKIMAAFNTRSEEIFFVTDAYIYLYFTDLFGEG
jgi:hypothetical protein